jgi:phage protein D
VEDTEVVHEEAISTIIQRETDLQFLSRLALRNGFECYVENGTGYFRPPQLDEPPQPVLAAHFGDATTLVRFDVEVDALAPCQVAMFQIDRSEKEVLSARAQSTTLTLLGAEGAADLLPAGMEPAERVVAMSAALGQAEMSQLCQGLLHCSEWFVEAEGEVLANRYGHVLRPRRTVTVKGVGESHSGVYYVRRVSHVFTADGYLQRFQAVRNAIMPTGAEEFSADGGLLSAVGL